MSIKTLYIKANSKKAANEALKTGNELEVYEAKFMIGLVPANIEDFPTGTVVKIFSKFVGGQPYAKAYGNYNKEKNLIK